MLRHWLLRFYLLIWIVTGAIGHSGVTTVAVAQSTPTVHIVQRGETLSQIAAQYGVSYRMLARYNNIPDPDRLYVGQRICIPTQDVVLSTPTPERQVTYRWTPAGQRFTTFEPSATAIPTPTATTPPESASPSWRTGRSGEVVYSVRRGDNLTDIAASYGVTVDSIMARNNLSSSVIFVGQRLIIPSSNYIFAPNLATQDNTKHPSATPTSSPSSPDGSTSIPESVEVQEHPPVQPVSPLPTPAS